MNQVVDQVIDRRMAKLQRQCLATVAKPTDQRSKADLEPLLKFTANLPEFKKLPLMRREEVVRAIELEDFEDGKVVFWQGDEGDKYYVILTGAVDIWGIRQIVKEEEPMDVESKASRRKMSMKDAAAQSRTNRRRQSGMTPRRGSKTSLDDNPRASRNSFMMKTGLGTLDEAAEEEEQAEPGKGEGKDGAERGDKPKQGSSKWGVVKVVTKLGGLQKRAKEKAEAEAEEAAQKEAGIFTPTDNHTLFVTLHPQGAFGELALITNKPRAATVVAKGPTQLLAIAGDDYQRIMVGGMAKAIEEKVSFIKSVPIFKSIEESTHLLATLSYSFHLEIFKRGQVIYREGDKPDFVYIVKDGHCKVLKKSEDKEKKSCALAILGPKTVFGDHEILSNQDRKTTVVADTLTTVYQINPNGFKIMPPIILEELVEAADLRTEFEGDRLASIASTLTGQRRPPRSNFRTGGADLPDTPTFEAGGARLAMNHSMEHFKPQKSLAKADHRKKEKQPHASSQSKYDRPGSMTRTLKSHQASISRASLDRLTRPKKSIGENGVATGVRSSDLAVRLGRSPGIEREQRLRYLKNFKAIQVPSDRELARYSWSRDTDTDVMTSHLSEFKDYKGLSRKYSTSSR